MRFYESEDPVFPRLPGVDPVSLRVFHTFFKAVRLHRQLMFRLMSAKEAYPGQAACLLIVSNHDGITQRDLARKLHVASSTVTVMLQKMEAANLIVRRVDEADQRLTRIHVTDRGRMLQDEMNGVLAEFIDSTFGKMSLGDQEDLDRLLNMLCLAMSEEP
jgi:DNA-binding MarR family transcriptional regulator